jgi:hypothetical protein
MLETDLASTACPPPEVLERLLRGLIAEDETSRLERHLHECALCCQAVRSLDISDALLDAVRGVDAVDDLSNDEDVRGMIDRLKALPVGMPHRTGETLALVGDMTDADAWGLEGLLDPPEADGELGRLADYRVFRVLGAGGMGVVLAAEDPRLLRRVAIKVMDRRLAASDEYRQRFLREARAAAAIEHLHIVAVYQVGEHRGLPFLAMQLLEGESLEARIAREDRLPLEECLRIGCETAQALAAAHRRGLVHRDIKPANIWLQSPAGSVKLLDFGLAHFVENQTRMTHTGLVLGTPAYMSPEQARGDVAGPPTDLFSLGAVLYRLATGHQPFAGTSTLAVLTALAIERPTPPYELNPAIPRAFSDLIIRLLAKKPTERPASAEAVAGELRAIAAVSPREATTKGPHKAWPWLLATASAGLLLTVAVATFRPHAADRGVSRGLAPRAVPIGNNVLDGLGRPSSGHDDPPPVAVPDLDDEQAVAQWVLTTGGELNGNTRGIENQHRVSYPIHSILLNGKAIDDDCVPRLLRCPGLRALFFVNTSVGRGGLRQLAVLPELTYLGLAGNPQIADADLDELARIKTLLTLDLNHTRVTTAGLMRLAALPSLSSISIRGTPAAASPSSTAAPSPQAAAASAGATFQNLNELDLSDVPISDEGLAQLKPMTGLRSLNLSGTRATDAGIAELQQTLGDCWVTGPDGRSHAPPLRPGDPDRVAAERFLQIGFKITIADPQERQVSLAADLPAGPFRLVWVATGPKSCTDADLELLAPCRQLAVVHLWGDEAVTPAGLSHLRGLRKLAHLNLNDLPQMTDDVLAMLWPFAALRTVAFNGAPITNDGLRRLPDLPQLEYLDLGYTRVTGAGLKYLHKVPQLRQLLLAGTKLVDVDLEHLRSLKELRQLSLDSTTVGDAGVARLTELPKLEWLSLIDTPLTVDGLRRLRNLPRLRTLLVGGPGGAIDDDAMAAVAELQQLETLEIFSPRVTDVGLGHLRGLSRLKALTLRGTLTTEQGIAAFGSALPDCRITH